MREPKRIKPILELIEQIWLMVPDWRLGQLIVNATGDHRDPFYIEDDQLEEKLLELKGRLERSKAQRSREGGCHKKKSQWRNMSGFPPGGGLV